MFLRYKLTLTGVGGCYEIMNRASYQTEDNAHANVIGAHFSTPNGDTTATYYTTGVLPYYDGVSTRFRPYGCGPITYQCLEWYGDDCDCADNWWAFCDNYNTGEHTTVTVHWQQRDGFTGKLGLQAESGVCGSSRATYKWSEVEVYVAPGTGQWSYHLNYDCKDGGGASLEDLGQYGDTAYTYPKPGGGTAYYSTRTLDECKKLCDLIVHGDASTGYANRCYLRTSDQTGGVSSCAYYSATWNSYRIERWTVHTGRDCNAGSQGGARADLGYQGSLTLEACKVRCIQTRGCNLIVRGTGSGATGCWLETSPVPFEPAECTVASAYDAYALDLSSTHHPGELDEPHSYTAMPNLLCVGIAPILTRLTEPTTLTWAPAACRRTAPTCATRTSTRAAPATSFLTGRRGAGTTSRRFRRK